MSIVLKGVTKAYGSGVRALDRLDLEVQPGQIYALLGANGAGKTTTLNILLGFLPMDEGSAKVCGFDVRTESVRIREQISYIPEQVHLYPQLTGLENLEYILALGGLERSQDELREDLQKVGLDPKAAERPTRGYSKGMRQKVGLAIALARGSKVLLLDEPLSGLDPRSAKEFCDRIRTLTEDGCAVLMATHDLFRAREIGSKIGIMKDGRIVRELDPFEVSGADLEQIYLEHIVGSA